MADRLLKTKDVYNIINYMVEDITGQTSTTRVCDTSTFISAGETLLKYAKEDVLNSLALLVGRVLIASRPYKSRFDLIRTISSGIFSNRLEKISYYSDKAFNAGPFNTDLYTQFKNGYTNGTNGDNAITGTTNSTRSMWEQNRLYPLTMFFGGRSAWSYVLTVDDIGYANAFRGPGEFNDFVSGMLREHRNTIESGLESYRRATILNYIAGVYDMSAKMPGSVINLTEEFNNANDTNYSTDDLLHLYFDDFLAFFIEVVKTTVMRLEHRSVLYHWTPPKTDDAGNDLVLLRHTPRDRQKMLLYKPFVISAEANVMPKIFNTEYLKIENYEGVDFWQFEDPSLASSINVTPAIPDDNGGQVQGDAVNLPLVLGVLFDEDAVLVDTILERSETTPLEARKLYRNIWLHYSYNSINDFTEKGVIFIMKDPET